MYLYEMFLIRPDLRHEETIVQTANCFEYLNSVVNEVFDKIDARIERNNTKIQSLNERTAVVKNKIDSLVGINKAITIFSPVKYPGTAVAQDVEATFSPFNRSKITLNTDYKIQSKPDPISERSIEEKLQFFHVKKSPKQRTTIKSTQETLRPFPYYTESISNLLLFNETKIMFGRSSASSKSRTQRQDARSIEKPNTGSKIDSIPLPVLNRNLGTKKVNDHLFYTPNITNAPELDVPHYLPDLPGVADDIEFNIANIDDLLIVPMQSMSIDVPELPPVPSSEIKPPQKASNTLPDSKEPTIHATTTAQSHTIEKPISNQSASTGNAPSVLMAPPPPPPPPPPEVPVDLSDCPRCCVRVG